MPTYQTTTDPDAVVLPVVPGPQGIPGPPGPPGGGGGGWTIGAPVSLSGTSTDITGIPSGTQVIIVSLIGMSTNGGDNFMVQIGDSGGVETSGYAGSVSNQVGGTANFSSGFLILTGGAVASGVYAAQLLLTLENASNNTWSCGIQFSRADDLAGARGVGYKALSTSLDRIRITTSGGTNTFDAGEINIAYSGAATAGPPGPAGPPGAGAGIMVPGGRLTLSQNNPVMPPQDITSTTLWYAPYKGGDRISLLDSSLAWQQISFSAGALDTSGLALSCGSKWTANSQRDIYCVLTDNGPVLGSGSAWTGPSFASRSLVLYNGFPVNAAAIVLDTSESETVATAQYLARYLGSINVGTAGQLCFHPSYGQNRRCDVWNYYQQEDVVLNVGEKTIPPATSIPPFIVTNQYPDSQPFHYNANNRGIVFTGAPTLIENVYHQNTFVNSISGPSGVNHFVLWNGQNVGTSRSTNFDNNGTANGTGGPALLTVPNAVGVNIATMGISKINASTSSMFVSLDPAANPGFSECGNSLMLIRYKG